MKSRLAILLVGAFVLFACGPATATPTPIATEAPLVIPDGTSMRWLDGSTLVAVHVDTGQGEPRRLWVYRDDVNGYMFKSVR